MTKGIIKERTIGNCRLILGDCLEVMPLLGKVDAVVTDPPYGIADIWSGGSEKHGWTKDNKEGKLRNKWDDKPIGDEEINLITNISRTQIIWGGNYFPLPPSRCWLVWNKPERGFSLAEAELAWTNIDAVVRVFDCQRSEPDRVHPTQKPLKLMSWCIGKTKGSVLDPFMGSGTTGVACAKQNRRFIGIEREEYYFDIACKRIEEAYKQPDMFIEPPKKLIQESLL